MNSVNTASSHHAFMQRALTLARAQLGQTWPNPAVGCVIVKDQSIIAEGATQKTGRPHAETVALAKAGDAARGATLYVTLEPCSHHGKTPPCVEAIIAAGIKHVVVACRDPNPKVNGAGIAALKTAGIEITEQICESEARELNLGFFSVIERGRPFIAMKIAASKDGKIASQPGVCTKITGDAAREHSHHVRAEYDAILTGIGTVLADDPLLTVRISGMEHRSPVRVVLDSNKRLPENSQLMKTSQEIPVWVYARQDDVIAELTQRGITRLLVEAGQGVNSYFLENGLVDRLYYYQSPDIVGENGISAVRGSLDLTGWQIAQDPLLLGADTLTIYETSF